VRRLRGILALALGALGLAAGAAGAAPIMALQDDQLPNLDGPVLEQRLDLLAATGTRVSRLDILWRDVAPTRPADARDPADPAYRWGRYDAIVKGLVRRGITPIISYYKAPAWAARLPREEASAPRTADGAAFIGAVARRYSGTFPDPAGGTLPLVRRIEVWNEPNIAQFWYPQCRRQGGRYVLDSARAYAALLTAGYREIKRASPTAIVVGGVAGPVGDSVCTSSDSSVGTLDFAEVLVRERAPLDAWSQHLYPIGSPLRAYFVPSWATMPQLTRLVDKLRRGAPIYVTETGYHTSYNRYHRYFVSEAQQAAWVDETYRAASRYPRVEVAVWFNLQDNPFWTGGLLHADLSRKPAYDRFSRLARQGTLPAAWRS
jgi:hypothetical protein